jgi:hypothetical protein
MAVVNEEFSVMIALCADRVIAARTKLPRLIQLAPPAGLWDVALVEIFDPVTG